MTQDSAPQDGILIGDAVQAPYDADEWGLIWSKINGFAARPDYGVVQGYDNGTNFGLEVTQVAVPAANVELKVGAALVTGTLYWTDATVTLPIGANISGNARIDTVVIRKDYIAQTIRAVVRQGTPAATPVPPTLTQIANTTWEIPIADIAVANGFTTIVDANITGRHEFVNVGNGTFVDHVLNNSGAVLEDGDVVIWDYSTTRAATTTTISNHWKLAGVWRGRSAIGAYGRVQTKGFGRLKVRISNDSVSPASVGIGTPLVSGYVAKKATSVNIRNTVSSFRGTDGEVTNPRGRTGSAPALLGHLMQSTGTILGSGGTFDGLLLAYIDVQKRANPHKTVLKRKSTADNGTFTSGSWVARVFNQISHGAELDTSLAAPNMALNNYVSVNTGTGAMTLQPGRYWIKGWSAGYRCDGHLTRLQDTSNATTIVVSQPAYSPSAADSSQSFAELETFLIIEAATVYELQARCTTTRASDGAGKYVGFSAESVTFVYLEIERMDEVYT